MSTRPRRTTRSATKPEPSVPVASGSKPKATREQDRDAEVNIQHLLENPKSVITKVDLSDILNAETWTSLSLESQEVLSALLPPTAFQNYVPHLDPTHPIASALAHSESTSSSNASVVDLDLSLFKDSHFAAAARTYQDHIYSGWKTAAQARKVEQYTAGVRDGTLSAPYKDELWETDNAVAAPKTIKIGGVSGPIANARAGDAADVKLTDMVAASVLKVGDILSYKRNFSTLDIVIEKDAIIESIHPKTHAVTVLIPGGTTQYLPVELLSRQPNEPDDSDAIRRTTFSAPTSLESAILDIDGRVEKNRRPNGNAWKALTVWRWREDEEMETGEDRWGRESHGPLFYIRGCFYHDR